MPYAAAVSSEHSVLRAPPPSSTPGRRVLFSWLEIPDGYHIDLTPDPPRFADPVDRDTLVAIGLLGRRPGPVALELDVEKEDRPITGSSDLFRVVVEVKF